MPTSLRAIAEKASTTGPVRKRTVLKSPVRENCTPGSVRGRSGDWPTYLDGCMNVAALIYVWLPAALALGCTTGSILISVRSRKVTNFCLSLVVGVAVYWSLYTLYEVVALNNGHALWFVVHGKSHLLKYLPQTVILAAFGVFVLQVLSSKPNAA